MTQEKIPELYRKLVIRKTCVAYFGSKRDLFNWKNAQIPHVITFRIIEHSPTDLELHWSTEEIMFG